MGKERITELQNGKQLDDIQNVAKYIDLIDKDEEITKIIELLFSENGLGEVTTQEYVFLENWFKVQSPDYDGIMEKVKSANGLTDEDKLLVHQLISTASSYSFMLGTKVALDKLKKNKTLAKKYLDI
ncbi:MAG: hypothetical protein MJ231_02225 [bacterium]|nr:hypothetical protein [bacterium]